MNWLCNFKKEKLKKCKITQNLQKGEAANKVHNQQLMQEDHAQLQFER
jgi:hypothetical protein